MRPTPLSLCKYIHMLTGTTVVATDSAVWAQQQLESIKSGVFCTLWSTLLQPGTVFYLLIKNAKRHVRRSFLAVERVQERGRASAEDWTWQADARHCGMSHSTCESSGWPFIHTSAARRPVISIVLFQMAHHLFQTAWRKGSSARAAPHSYHPLTAEPL
ncbi:hypothetical protein SRHO_G00170410 [Serrasalmus rhombeus]